MAKTVIGRVRAKYQGNWDSTKSYVNLDRVDHDGILWEAIKDVPALNDAPNENSEYWFAISSSDPKNVVRTDGDQTIEGVKTFKSAPVIDADIVDSDEVDNKQAANVKYVQDKISPVDTKVTKLNNDAVHKDGTETISGEKTFTNVTHGVTRLLTDNSDAYATTAFVQGLLAKIQEGWVDLDAHLIVSTEGDQIINGEKTFSISPIVPTVLDLSEKSKKAVNALYVHNMIEATLNGLDANADIWIKKFDGKIPTSPEQLATLLERMPKGSAIYFTKETEYPLWQVEEDAEGNKSLAPIAISAIDNITQWIKYFEGKEEDIPDLQEYLKDAPHNGAVIFSEGDDIVDDNGNIDIEALKAFIAENYISLIESQTIQGTKTFEESPIVPTPADDDDTDKIATMKALQKVKALVNDKVSKAGDTMSGELVFANDNASSTDLTFLLPLNAKEVLVPETSIYRELQFLGLDNGRFGFLRSAVAPDTGIRVLSLCLVNEKNAPHAAVDIYYDVADSKQAYVKCPPPRENSYSNDVDTLASSINRHPLISRQAITVFVDSNDPNASDTADLFTGRGSEAKPFKTLIGAISFLSHYYTNSQISIRLKSDITYPGSTIIVPFSLRFYICSHDSANPVTINATNTCNILKGVVCLENVKWKAASAIDRFFVVGFYAGESIIEFGNNVVLEGTVNSCTLWAKQGGLAIITGALTGNVTGRRYVCTNGGRILTMGKGATAIPGTTEGTCDAGSLYF